MNAVRLSWAYGPATDPIASDSVASSTAPTCRGTRPQPAVSGVEPRDRGDRRRIRWHRRPDVPSSNGAPVPRGRYVTGNRNQPWIVTICGTSELQSEPRGEMDAGGSAWR